MHTRHEKNVEKKRRRKEREDAIARSLRERSLRPTNTRGLRTLQMFLGLPLNHCLFLEEQVPEDGFKRLGYELGREERSSNPVNIPFVDDISDTKPESAIPIPQGTNSQNPEFLMLYS